LIYNGGVEWIQPYIGQLTFGGLAGFAVGFAIKTVGRWVAVILGLLFVVVQVLASLGYIQVDWTRIQRDVEPYVNNTGVQNLWNNLVALLTNNLPFGGAFVAGLLIGLRSG
jgi:uncharacterized membrane protein (Fun14 family)